MDSSSSSRLPSAGGSGSAQQEPEFRAAGEGTVPERTVPSAASGAPGAPPGSFRPGAGDFEPRALSWWSEPIPVEERIGRSHNWVTLLIGASVVLLAMGTVLGSIGRPDGLPALLGTVLVTSVVFKLMDRYWPWVRVSHRGAKQRVFGTAGESLAKGWVPFSREAVEKGVAGERRTALALEALLRIPGTRIVHGLKFPGSRVADVDHAVLNGDRVVFIDTKFWAPGHYRWDGPSALLLRGPRRTERRTVHMDVVLKDGRIRAVAPNIACHVILHPSKPGEVSFAPGGQVSPDGIPATTVQEGIEAIGRWLLDGSRCGEVDLRTLGRLLAMRK